ncbi:MAG TPA: phenylalanine--tRNA ligase beta subunit-related protein [Selenomonadales bacterium]|nr:phenylalanine--tRNA ligase beta subunit-related protein [Selenomonadales bacterium]
MKFYVADEVFERMGEVCFGVVYAKGINNRNPLPEIGARLADSITRVEGKFANEKVREAPEIAPYRDAFGKLGLNPNKFMSSIEAMASRVEKGKGLPRINPVVDLGNAVSLKYLVPIGAHDTDKATGDIQVRFSRRGDTFTPFGESEAETLDEGELIYSVGEKVKTRRWIWRQSEEGKITEESRSVFFPIDGFKDRNLERVIAARTELAELLEGLFACEVKVGLVDKDNRELDL